MLIKTDNVNYKIYYSISFRHIVDASYEADAVIVLGICYSIKEATQWFREVSSKERLCL